MTKAPSPKADALRAMREARFTQAQQDADAARRAADALAAAEAKAAQPKTRRKKP